MTAPLIAVLTLWCWSGTEPTTSRPAPVPMSATPPPFLAPPPFPALRGSSIWVILPRIPLGLFHFPLSPSGFPGLPFLSPPAVPHSLLPASAGLSALPLPVCPPFPPGFSPFKSNQQTFIESDPCLSLLPSLTVSPWPGLPPPLGPCGQACTLEPAHVWLSARPLGMRD